MVQMELDTYDDMDSDYSFQSDIEPDEPTLKRKLNLNESKTNKKPKHDDSDDDSPKELKTGKTKNDLYKQPTADELNRLKETENLFNSNIFRLQIDELLTEVKPKQKHINQYDKWYTSFKAHLETILELGEVHLDDIKRNNFKKKSEKYIKSVLAELEAAYKSNTILKLTKPTSVSTFGKYNSITAYSPNICVTISKTTFYEKDYLNFKYAIKKRCYLQYLLQHIKTCSEVADVKIDFYLGNVWMPILIITPNYSDKMSIKLFVVPENDTFKPTRFLPNKNNVKQNLELLSNFSDLDVDTFATEPTPFYNSVVLHDITLEINHDVIKKTLEDLTNVQDGIKLLAVWLRQRNLNIAYGGFTNDLMLFLTIYLCVKKKINKHMSSYQVVRIFWSFLVTHNGDVLSISEEVKLEHLELFKERFPLVLLDASGCYNVAAFLDADILAKVRMEATMALSNLDSNKFNTFTTLFTMKMPIGLQYDTVVRIVDDSDFSKIYTQCIDSEKFHYLGFYKILIHKYVSKYIKQGLNKRVIQVVPIFSENHTEGMNHLTYGISLNPLHCSDVVEKGPRQFDVGAEEFKSFWGTLAELRRFKDSSIYEAVYFSDAKSIQEKRLIFKQILKFVLKKKLKLNYTLNADETEKLLKVEGVETSIPLGSNEEVTLKIKSAHFELSRILRDLKLPLSVTAVQGISDVFSYTDVFPPMPRNYKAINNVTQEDSDNLLFAKKDGIGIVPRLVSPIECVIQLALNSKWPKDLQALRAIKQSFNFEMSKLLKEQQIKSTVYADYLDIYYEGFVFRARLYHPKEVALLKKDVTSDGVTCYRDTRESLEMERMLDVLPKVSGALNGIHQEHPCFGPSTCLIKRWLRSQLLDDHHISDTVINILNASLFLQSDPFVHAILPQVAFLRFLKFVSEYDFNFQPVIVNFNNEITNDDLNELETKFLQNRQNFSSLHIISPYDEGKSVFTKHSPSKDTLRRIRLLAGVTYKNLVQCIDEGTTLKFKQFFIPNLEGYNLLIHLNPVFNPRRYEQLTHNPEHVTRLRDFDPDLNQLIPVTGFNPVEFYLKELRENYGDYALFFHDTYGGSVIGVLWKEKAQENVDFKILAVNGRHYTKGQLSLNTEALIEDFKILGSGLVESIDVRK